MRSRLLFKLFAVLLATAAVVVLAMMLFMRWSFDRGFVDYLDRLQADRAADVVERLETAWSEWGSWHPLQQPRAWRDLVRDTDEPFQPRPRGRDAQGRTEPFAHRERGMSQRFTLFDANYRVIAGPDRSPGELLLLPVRQAGATVGWLGRQPVAVPASARDIQFRREQSRMLQFVGLFTVLIAGLVSLLLAHRLLTPVKALTTTARRLAAGDYQARVPVSGHDELAQLAADFNHLAATLANNEQLRRRWIADISHELRTPLAVLRGEIEALQDGVRPLRREVLPSLHGEVLQVSRLVDDLYQLALSDLGALDYRKVVLDPIEQLDAIVARYQTRFADAGLALRRVGEVGPVQLEADPDRLVELFQNLLENSLRYTDRGGRLEIRLTLEAADLTVSFCDSAPTAPPEERPRLFEPLYRGERSRNRATGGAGLGLAIVRTIAAAHGGTAEADASPLGGLCIRLRFPVQVAPDGQLP